MIGSCAGESLPRVVVWEFVAPWKVFLGSLLGCTGWCPAKRFVVRGDWLVSRSLDLVPKSFCEEGQPGRYRLRDSQPAFDFERAFIRPITEPPGSSDLLS